MHRLHDSFEVSHLFSILAHTIMLSLFNHSFNISKPCYSFLIDFIKFLFSDFILMLHSLFEFRLMLVVIFHDIISFD